MQKEDLITTALAAAAFAVAALLSPSMARGQAGQPAVTDHTMPSASRTRVLLHVDARDEAVGVAEREPGAPAAGTRAAATR
jgi:hypothetical protein